MQISDTNGPNRVLIGAKSPATARVVTVKGRAVACDVALFGRSALASDMPPLRDTARRPGPARLDPLSPGGRQNVRHPAQLRQGLSVFSSRVEQEG